jgi:ubiquinone/menaquinone biosynthesis methyltransferase
VRSGASPVEPGASPVGEPGAPPVAAGASPVVDLYDPAYVRALFDAMAATYERVNLVTSFGFSRRWRRQAVDRLAPEPGWQVLDLMTGMGEGWPYLARHLGTDGRVIAVDLSPGMLRHAIVRRDRMPDLQVEVLEANALACPVADASVDGVLCLFGLKTLSPEQQEELAAEIARVLRPGGRFSLVEVSVPPAALLRIPYLFYLSRVIPLLGRLLLGDPDGYRMLGVYTRRFGRCEAMAATCHRAGMEARVVGSFFGCATGVVGRRRG